MYLKNLIFIFFSLFRFVFYFFLPFSSYQSISFCFSWFRFAFVGFVSFRWFRFVSFRFRWFRFVSFLFRFALYRYPIYMRLWITNISTLCVWFYRLIRPCVWKLGWNTYIHETTLLFSTMCSDSVDFVFIFSSHFVGFFILFDCFIKSFYTHAHICYLPLMY